MASSSSGSKIFILKSSDGDIIHVEESIASHSDLLKSLIKQSDSNVLPQLVLKGNALRKIIAFIRHHLNEDNPKKLKKKGKIIVPQLDLKGDVLEKAIEYLKIRFDGDIPEKLKEKGKLIVDDVEEEIEGWDEALMSLDSIDVFDLMVAADYLDIKSVFQKMLGMVMDALTGKSPDEIRERLNIMNDFPEQIRHEYPWPYE